MRILFIIPTYKPAYIYGGPVVVVALLAETLVQLGHEVTVYATTANGNEELPDTSGRSMWVDGVKTFYFRRITKDHTHVSFNLWRHLYKTAKGYDVIHIHSWWSPAVVGAALICRLKKIKPVLSPHGMFSNYVLTTNNPTIKKWTQRLLGKALLYCTWLHASSQMEWNESQRIVPGWKGTVIPNLVLLPALSPARQTNDVFTIGFLSRLDPKKGLDVLIQALAKVSFPYRLMVAGNGEPDYIQSLKSLAKTAGNSKCIEWIGWKNGDEKFTFLAQLDLFSLTSYSENFAIVIIESLSVGTPVFISNGIGLASYIEEHQLGWVTAIDTTEITSRLETAYQDKQSRQRIETESPEMIEHHFDKLELARRYVHFYENLKQNVL